MDVAVIGAGPYGLSVAANLRRAGLNICVYGRPMETWREHMPAGMVLKSDGFASNFGKLPWTLGKFCEDTGRAYADLGHRTPIADIIAYADFIQDQYVGDVQDQRLTSLRRERDGFRLGFANGDSVFASRVVLATGLTGLARLPQLPVPSDRLTHVSAFNSFARFAGKRVLMIGGGQSAFESAALLHEQGAEVRVLSRRESFWFSADSEGTPSLYTRIRHPNWGLGPGWRAWLWSEAPTLFAGLPANVRLATAYSTFGPAGSGWLRHRVLGKIPCDVGTIVRSHETSNGLAVKTETWQREFDHVIAATGYVPEVRNVGSFIEGVLPAMKLLAPGIPELRRGYETSIPGLHIVGYLSAASKGPVNRFIYGTNFAAPHLTRSIKAGSVRRSVPIPFRKEFSNAA